MNETAVSPTRMSLAGQVAFVTGAASGFGKAIAETFVVAGAKVAIVDRDLDGARRVAETLGAHGLAVGCDVSDKAQVEDAVAATVHAFGGLHIVVNNAGVSHVNRPLLEIQEAEFDRVMAINVKSIYLTTLAAVPALKAAGGGSILNIGSTAGIRPRPGLTWYNASKGAVNLLSKSMAVELAPEGIRVNCIAPVAGETPLLPTFMGADTPELRAKFIASIPLGRLSQPQDIANAALFLSAAQADFVTGVVLEVDGGRCV